MAECSFQVLRCAGSCVRYGLMSLQLFSCGPSAAAESRSTSRDIKFDAKCSLVVGGRTYVSRMCRVDASQFEVQGGVSSSFQFGDYPKDRYFVIVNINDGQSYALWNNGGSRAQVPLGPVVRSADCWTNTSTKICIGAREKPFAGRCRLTVNNRVYISGPCSIETYRPFGDVHMVELKRTPPRYSAMLYPFGETGIAAWSGDPPHNDRQSDLGRVKRQGACWTSNVAKICAFR